MISKIEEKRFVSALEVSLIHEPHFKLMQGTLTAILLQLCKQERPS
jgi:hypothetical protein